jgi:hypothetical protein
MKVKNPLLVSCAADPLVFPDEPDSVRDKLRVLSFIRSYHLERHAAGSAQCRLLTHARDQIKFGGDDASASVRACRVAICGVLLGSVNITPGDIPLAFSSDLLKRPAEGWADSSHHMKIQQDSSGTQKMRSKQFTSWLSHPRGWSRSVPLQKD